ncbi:hypothetical protein H2O64_16465 [Kordia sp. YSTF-M3]|uniref:Uncharacterized protein n=1 Tax=Kordia aestuariivivens TaxID=2759037 RepID=A0ABR7QCH0_9FLAO|nr:hypothetical protein [Kordia aestuariivivens]MBC8756269.1 hypothetical protein [Kordia aestuariivivens]
MKKVFGYIFLVIGIFISLGLLSSLPKSLKEIFGKSQTGIANDTAYIAGFICGILFLAVIAFLLIRFGLKWISRKPVIREVDDIGRK